LPVECRRAGRIAAWPRRVARAALLWLERARQRRVVDRLSDHLLKDLGLHRSDLDENSGNRSRRA
jgi:uncharacterized protein YjiS (DUF1127 family)